MKKRCDLELKMVRFGNKIAPLRLNQIARITSDFKMYLINILISFLVIMNFFSHMVNIVKRYEELVDLALNKLLLLLLQ